MARKKLTARMIESLPTREKGDYKVFDSEQIGFGVRVYATGGQIYFVGKRLRGRLRWLRIGRVGELPLAEARQKAREILAEAGRGADPFVSPDGATVKALIDTYIKQWSKVHKKERSIAEDESLAEKHLIPALGKKRASSVTGGDIAALRNSMKKCPVRFNAARALLSHAFNLAMKGEHGPLGGGWGVSSNPCVHVEKNKTAKRGRVLTADEWKALGEALATGDEHPPAIAAIRLLALTGARRNEILTARVDWIDRNCIRLPDSKTGPKVIALPAAAVAIVKELRTTWPFSPWLIPGSLPGARVQDLEKPWQRIREAASLSSLRLHDLRHSFITTGGDLGLASALLQRAAGHANAATTERYLHVGTDPVAQAVEAVGAVLAERLAL